MAQHFGNKWDVSLDGGSEKKVITNVADFCGANSEVLGNKHPDSNDVKAKKKWKRGDLVEVQLVKWPAPQRGTILSEPTDEKPQFVVEFPMQPNKTKEEIQEEDLQEPKPWHAKLLPSDEPKFVLPS